MANKYYLVQVVASLLGGGEVTCFDIMEGINEIEAFNKTTNIYLLAAEGDIPNAVGFGRVLFFPGTVASIEVSVLGVLDVSDEFTRNKWQQSIDSSKEWERKLEAALSSNETS